jgi:hypothetical protein
MLMAIFTGRNEPKRLRPLPSDEDWHPAAPPPSTQDSTGIQKRNFQDPRTKIQATFKTQYTICKPTRFLLDD